MIPAPARRPLLGPASPADWHTKGIVYLKQFLGFLLNGRATQIHLGPSYATASSLPSLGVDRTFFIVTF